MSKAIFLFISSLLLLVPLLFYAGNISAPEQLLLTAPFILLFGIPHGAIDNLLYLRNSKMSNARFIAIYLIFVAANVAIWILSPKIAYPLFLILSAYHFGQSQFTHYFKKQFFAHKVLFMCWGVSILSGLLYFNISEIQIFMKQDAEFLSLIPFHREVDMLGIFLSSTAITVLILVYLTSKKLLTAENMFMELLVLSLVLISFFLLPFLIAFSIYFVILHSFKVLREEYHFLNSEKKIHSIKNFIQLMTPFTLLSVVGILFLFGLIYFEIFTFSYGYALLIAISSITLPHVFVMDKFYALLSSEKKRS